MIKSILKGIFPRTFLKEVFLILNKLKINSWDKFFFPEKFIATEVFLAKEEINPFLSNKVITSGLSKEAQKKLGIWLDQEWNQDQYFLHYKDPAFLEPKSGWAITSDHRLIYPSLGFSRAPHVHKPNWVESYIHKGSVVDIPRIISLRDTGEENYFHFFNDVLSKLFYIQDQSFDLTNFTIVVSEKLFKKEYFQFFYQKTWLKELTWHVQSKEWIAFKEAIFCKPYTHSRKYLDRAVDLVRPKLITNKTRKIFLTRSKNSLRFIENMDEVKPLLELYQFEIVDSGDIKISRQIELFSECRYLISVHGAGITNIIFRQGNPLSLLEIVQPSSYIPFHYVMLAHQYEYSYDVLLGEIGKHRNQGGFRINYDLLKVSLENMLKPSNHE